MEHFLPLSYKSLNAFVVYTFFFYISYRAYITAELLEPHVNPSLLSYFHLSFKEKKFPLSGSASLSS